jgi:hypothetical protein
MYQDKIPQSVIDAVYNNKSDSPRSSIFETKNLSPLTFEPYEFFIDICRIARDILKDRSDEDIIIISKAINSMSEQGGAFAMALLRHDEAREQVYISQGRELYFLSHYYDISSLPIKKLTWSEVFAVLALMQCAEVTATVNQEFNDDDLSQALKKNAEMFPIIMQGEIADSIARAECFYDNKHTKKTHAQSGGKGKAENFKPLKDYVLELYLKEFNIYSNRKAGKLILKQMTDENNQLLLKSFSEDKAQDFSKWIGQFRKGDYKIEVKI